MSYEKGMKIHTKPEITQTCVSSGPAPVADPGCPPQGGLINRDLEQMSKINDEITSGGANQ